MIWFAAQTWPFGAALLLMLALLAIESAGLLLSLSPSAWLDGLLPQGPDGVDGLLGWLHLGRLPFLILLGLFLAGFSLSGYALQAFSDACLGRLLPAWLSAIPAALAGAATVRSVGGPLARLMPSDQSSAVSELSLIGRAGVIVQGVARAGTAAQAKVRDAHGRTHHVLAEPDVAGECFEEGAAVLLVNKKGARYQAIRNPHPERL